MSTDGREDELSRTRALFEQRFGDIAVAPSTPDVAQGLAKILSRRTVRRFRDESIDEALVETLLACAQSAPSKSDLQAWSVVRVRDSKLRGAIVERIPEMPWIASAPEFLVFCAETRRGRRIAELRGRPFANDNLDTFVNATMDATIAMTTLIVAAESVGLGCCCISAVRDCLDDMCALLDLPSGVYPIAGLCMGHPAQPGWVSMRLPPVAVVHTDRYDDTDLAAQVDAYDQRRDARFAIPPERQKYVDRYGTAGFYGWSENVARQLSVPERATFRAFLTRHGFALE